MRLFLSFFCFCTFLLLFASKAFCQENYTARWYTSDNNELPQSSIKAIVPDKYNFIWMSTENGLVRYDGSNFLTFNSTTTGLELNRFSGIYGNISNDSLYSYHDYKKDLVLINQRTIQTIKKDIPIYKIRNGKNFVFYDGLPSYNSINPNQRYYIKLANGNTFFIDTEEIELCDKKMKSLFKIPYKNNDVFNFFAINNTLYYLKNNGEYHSFSKNEKKSGKLNPALFKTQHKLYWNVTANQVFLCIGNKIHILTTNDGQLSALPIIEFRDLNKYSVVSAYYDLKNKKLYLGSSTNGLCIISLSTFETVKRKSHNTDIYYATLPFTDNSVITPEGIIINNEKIVDSIPFIKSIDYRTNSFNRSLTIAKDDNNDIWITRGFYVLCYLKKTEYKKYIKYNLGQTIKTLFKDLDNRIWISLEWYDTHNSNLYYIENGILKHVATTNTDITYIAQYNRNTLYLGSQKGLYKYDIQLKKLFFIKNTEKIKIRYIYIDSSKKIWLTTYEKGFFLYSDTTLYSFPKDKNHYLNSSHSIVEDKKGFFWIPTNKGIFQVSRQALLNYSKKKTHAIYYYHYTKEDGFLTNEFNGGCQPSGNYLKNNYIALPSMNGMVFFRPDSITPLVPDKELYVDKILMDRKLLLPKDTIILDNNFKRIRFSIATPYYGNYDNLDIEAKLDGTTTTNWEKIGPEKSLSFTTLPPGEYTLTIRSLSGFNSGYVYKRITLLVPARFYQTFYFKILCVVLAGAFIISLWYMRLYYIKLKNRKLKQIIAQKTATLAKTVDKLKLTKNNLKQEAEQQERLVKSISHDIKSPLKFLISSIDNLFLNTYVQEDLKLKREVDAIHTSSVHLYEYVENLIKYSTIFIEGKKLEDKNYSFYGLVEEKIQIFKHIAYAENTSIINKVVQNTYIRTNHKALSIIIHNLIDNAVKNTKNGSIELFCTTEGNILTLTIKDTGKGMSEELIGYYLDFYKKPIVNNYHLGLHMIIELLVILNGSINITSKVGSGTTIEIKLEYA